MNQLRRATRAKQKAKEGRMHQNAINRKVPVEVMKKLGKSTKKHNQQPDGRHMVTRKDRLALIKGELKD